MTPYTHAHEFLSEVPEINCFIDDIISRPRKSDWHWPSFYLLYVDVDRLAMALMRVENFFNSSLRNSSMPTAIDDLVENTNAILSDVTKRQKEIFSWFYRMTRRIVYSAEDTALRARLDAHVHPKSDWYQTFYVQYDAGMLSVDGVTLTRKVLALDNFMAGCMLQLQTFDFSTRDEQKALADATKKASIKLGRIGARMQAYLLEHCKLEDLLYPCSA